MLELVTVFTPADGSPPRTITLRISDVRPDPDGFTWSVAVDVLGFKYDDSVRLKQVDWATAIEDAGRFIKRMVTDKVELAGGGTLEPPILPPES
ncbi:MULTISPECIES: hypothetical protein [Sorangium]|uniref:Uncharacterized protein n=1 Tax=Sorangium cellulosum TaxID=56 RepID=A0A4P2QPH9_SORCE|nr:MULTISPECIES: hypothetical protein [Sorangium]AUX32077.1 hypothetical protein SOCE836_042130 [Sorangium cellulosum]WCQ91448.1 hypothetical protein NQZ70_04167 [Sorangium sp. Soce836]